MRGSHHCTKSVTVSLTSLHPGTGLTWVTSETPSLALVKPSRVAEVTWRRGGQGARRDRNRNRNRNRNRIRNSNNKRNRYRNVNRNKNRNRNWIRNRKKSLKTISKLQLLWQCPGRQIFSAYMVNTGNSDSSRESGDGGREHQQEQELQS